MKYNLPRIVVTTALLLPLLFLLHACQCVTAARNDGREACAACGTMPPLPRLPRG